MKTKIKIAAFCLSAFVAGSAITNFAVSNPAVGCKVAVVDVKKVVVNSKSVKDLTASQQKKVADLAAFVETARANVAKEKDAKKKQALEKKYNDQLNAKKDAIDKEAAKKLAEIDKNVSLVIKKEAEAQKYNLVFAKGTVLYGGTDITDNIIKQVK